MNTEKRAARAKRKARASRLQRWPNGRNAQRLQRAAGPGSLNETNELRALIVAGKADEAAKYYERCHEINYRVGEPKVRWGREWYIRYTADRLAAEYGRAQS